MQVISSLVPLIGNTPLLEASRFSAHFKLQTPIYAKLEMYNPSGSVKDRTALAMIDHAERSGKIKPGTVLIEPTSGNTGIGLAAIAAVRGYRTILTMPETMSIERRRLLKAYGAELVLTDGALGMNGAIQKALDLAQEIPDSFIPSQFENPANPDIHYRTTGPEIWQGCTGKIDWLIAGVGTGGTISGAGKYLKEHNPSIQIAAVEPLRSPALSKGEAGAHGIQGIGAGFIPQTMDMDVCDEIIAVSDEDAFEYGRVFARCEGILAGISSGAALRAAHLVGARTENRGKRIVVILPDSGDRYLSSPMFANEQN